MQKGLRGSVLATKKGAKSHQKRDPKTDAIFERENGPRVLPNGPSRGSGEGVGGGVNPSPKGIGEWRG